MSQKPHIAVFISFSGHGGVERMVLNLVNGMVQQGYSVELVLVKNLGGHAETIPPQVKVTPLGAKHTITSVFKLAKYIKEVKPTAMLAAKDRAIKAAIMARWLSGTKFRLIGRLGTTVSAALKGKNRLRQWSWFRGMRTFYPRLDTIVAVSEGVKQDVLDIVHDVDPSRIQVIRNPVCTPRLIQLADEALDHPWFQEQQNIPVIMGVGRMTRQKDFPTLLKAFALVRKKQPCRLIILGEGPHQEKLNQLAAALGIAEHLHMPGFTPNPYQYLRHASLFVLSSLWEGSPNVLTEALALGVPVVATDCPSGPSEILDGGKYGPLVEMGNVEAMASAMAQTLAKPLPADFLKQSVKEYTQEASVGRYLQALLGDS